MTNLPLLLSKLSPPRESERLVERRRLLDQCQVASKNRTLLISAPAGFGKTTVAAQWYWHLVKEGQAVAWVSWESGDDSSDPFVAYLRAALQRCGMPWSQAFQQILQQRDSDLDALLSQLIDEFETPNQRLTLFFDDFHQISDPVIHRAIVSFIHRVPPQMTLVICSRHLPDIALSGLRAYGQLAEIHSDRLRFDLDEAQAFFQQNSGIELNGDQVRYLVDLTEGWATGLQLAALTPDIGENTRGLFDKVNGSNKLIGRYLEDVVLAQLPERTVEFLIRSAILERMCGDLCEAVTGLSECAALLRWLETQGMFLVVLDNEGEWFRFHHLFRSALLALLRRRSKSLIPELNERAARWFLDRELWSEAIRHALAGGCIELTLSIASEGAAALAAEGDLDTLLRWLNGVKPASLSEQIRLQLTQMWALAHGFRFAEAHALGQTIETAINQYPELLPRTELHDLQVIRAVCANFADDTETARQLVEPIFDQLSPQRIWSYGLGCNVLAYAYVTSAKYESVRNVLVPLLLNAELPSANPFVLAYGKSILANAYFRQAKLDEAEQLLQEALTFCTTCFGPFSTTAVMQAGQLAAIAAERGDMESATRVLVNRMEVIDRTAGLDTVAMAYMAAVHSQLVAGNEGEAKHLLDHCENLSIARAWPRMQAVCIAERIGVLLNGGDHASAQLELSRLAQLAEPPACELIADYCCLAGVLVHWATGTGDNWLPQLQEAIERNRRNGSRLFAIRLEVIQIVVQAAAGIDGMAARALQIFREAYATGMRFTLTALPAFAELVLANDAQALAGLTAEQRSFLQGGASQFVVDMPSSDPVLEEGEHLSVREREVLALLENGLSNKEMARDLNVSQHTIKWHLRSVYQKLGVTTRLQALHAARSRAVS